MENKPKRLTIFNNHECGFVHLFLALAFVLITLGGLFYYSWQKGLVKTPAKSISPTSVPSQNNMPNWKKYKNEELNLEFKYPEEFIVKDNVSSISISSPQLMCREKGSAQPMKPTNEIVINATLHKEKTFADIWKEVHGFDFEGENSYDGLEYVDTKNAYYFYQGAEMSFGRKAYLIKVSQLTAMQVDIFTPIYTFECDGEIQEFTHDEKYSDLTSQILSTFRFLD